MINYIIQVGLFQLLFLAVYDIFIRKETFFNWNRVYLLATPILSFTIPFIRINAFERASQTNFAEHLPAVILNPQESISNAVPALFTVNFYLLLFFGMLLMLGLFLYKLTSLLILRHKSTIERHRLYTLVIIDKPGVVFSFFNEIYIDKSFLKQAHEHILSHEMVHINHYHSVDLLCFEFLKIINWFNPIIYIYQNRITELHEFIADAKTIKPQNKNAFFNNLLTTSFKVTNVDFINQFYKHSLIKKRIMMTNKNKSKQVLKLKYLLLVPALASMLFYSSCEQKKQTIEEQIATLKASIAEKDKLTRAEAKEIMSLMVMKDLRKKLPERTDSTHTEIQSINSVPFAIVEQAPIYPGCEDAKNQKGCLSGKITALVAQNFDTKLTKGLNLMPGKKRIFVMFKIDKTGKVVDIQARGPHKKLAAEAIRVIKLIPQMKPGFDKGKAVAVKYSLPIVFNVQK
ncbi:MAG: M56 family metallopeptidase [Flavobacteriaceae bacterium]|nr:M56 family metallopeptidase [Flavobacteriaceae bacterium]